MDLDSNDEYLYNQLFKLEKKFKRLGINDVPSNNNNDVLSKIGKLENDLKDAKRKMQGIMTIFEKTVSDLNKLKSITDTMANKDYDNDARVNLLLYNLNLLQNDSAVTTYNIQPSIINDSIDKYVINEYGSNINVGNSTLTRMIPINNANFDSCIPIYINSKALFELNVTEFIDDNANSSKLISSSSTNVKKMKYTIKIHEINDVKTISWLDDSFDHYGLFITCNFEEFVCTEVLINMKRYKTVKPVKDGSPIALSIDSFEELYTNKFPYDQFKFDGNNTSLLSFDIYRRSVDGQVGFFDICYLFSQSINLEMAYIKHSSTQEHFSSYNELVNMRDDVDGSSNVFSMFFANITSILVDLTNSVPLLCHRSLNIEGSINTFFPSNPPSIYNFREEVNESKLTIVNDYVGKYYKERGAIMPVPVDCEFRDRTKGQVYSANAILKEVNPLRKTVDIELTTSFSNIIESDGLCSLLIMDKDGHLIPILDALKFGLDGHFFQPGGGTMITSWKITVIALLIYLDDTKLDFSKDIPLVMRFNRSSCRQRLGITVPESSVPVSSTDGNGNYKIRCGKDGVVSSEPNSNVTSTLVKKDEVNRIIFSDDVTIANDAQLFIPIGFITKDSEPIIDYGPPFNSSTQWKPKLQNDISSPGIRGCYIWHYAHNNDKKPTEVNVKLTEFLSINVNIDKSKLNLGGDSMIVSGLSMTYSFDISLSEHVSRNNDSFGKIESLIKYLYVHDSLILYRDGFTYRNPGSYSNYEHVYIEYDSINCILSWIVDPIPTAGTRIDDEEFNNLMKLTIQNSLQIRDITDEIKGIKIRLDQVELCLNQGSILGSILSNLGQLVAFINPLVGMTIILIGTLISTTESVLSGSVSFKTISESVSSILQTILSIYMYKRTKNLLTPGETQQKYFRVDIPKIVSKIQSVVAKNPLRKIRYKGDFQIPFNPLSKRGSYDVTVDIPEINISKSYVHYRSLYSPLGVHESITEKYMDLLQKINDGTAKVHHKVRFMALEKMKVLPLHKLLNISEYSSTSEGNTRITQTYIGVGEGNSINANYGTAGTNNIGLIPSFDKEKVASTPGYIDFIYENTKANPDTFTLQHWSKSGLSKDKILDFADGGARRTNYVEDSQVQEIYNALSRDFQCNKYVRDDKMIPTIPGIMPVIKDLIVKNQSNYNYKLVGNNCQNLVHDIEKLLRDPYHRPAWVKSDKYDIYMNHIDRLLRSN